ncbi:hypothetical protein LZG72_00055 [Dyadobacter sp. CY323]|nr:hypothetical protein [Dyadobacter sp. CY323]
MGALYAFVYVGVPGPGFQDSSGLDFPAFRASDMIYPDWGLFQIGNYDRLPTAYLCHFSGDYGLAYRSRLGTSGR